MRALALVLSAVAVILICAALVFLIIALVWWSEDSWRMFWAAVLSLLVAGYSGGAATYIIVNDIKDV